VRATLPALTALAFLLGGCPQNEATDPCAGALSGCVDKMRAFSCIKGVYREIFCGDERTCVEGECKRQVCDPALFFCDGQNAIVCDPTGTEETHTDCAAQKGMCVVGPLTASCVQQTCTPAQSYCAPDASEVRKCALDGLSFDVVQRCDDPQQRGNRCMGAACHDRCALLEAQDRSTVGCRFVTAARSGAASVLLLANPQPDLPATVVVRDDAGASTTRTIAAGGFLPLPWSAAATTGTSLAARAIYVTSTVPVVVSLGAGDGVTAHPEHALSTDYLVGVDGTAQTLTIVATTNATTVQVAPTAAIVAGGTVPATAAGGTLVQTLQRGQVLTLAASGSLSGTRVSASSPVAVIAASSAGATSLPGQETLGVDLVLAQPATVVARDATQVTAERDGTFTLAAGASRSVAGDQRLHASAPLLAFVVAGGLEVVPPVAQWRSEQLPMWSGGTASILASSAQPQSLSWASGATQSLPQVTTFAWAEFAGTTPMRLSGAQPFYASVSGAGDRLSCTYGLAQIQ